MKENRCPYEKDVFEESKTSLFNFKLESDCGATTIRISSTAEYANVRILTDGIVLNLNKAFELYISKPKTEEGKEKVREIISAISGLLV